MNIDLKNQKCQACSGNTPKFDEKQISKYLSSLDNWSVNDEQKMIFKRFNFKTFNEALQFTNKVTKEVGRDYLTMDERKILTDASWTDPADLSKINSAIKNLDLTN